MGSRNGGVDVTATADHSAGDNTWLGGSANQKTSDALLGCILLIAGAVPIWDTRDLPSSSWEDPGAGFFPTVVGAAMLAVGVLLLARAALFPRPPPALWGLRNVAIVIVAVVVLLLASWQWGYGWLLHFGPPDHAAAVVLILVSVIALARWSRLRAIGMMLLGLLLATVGLDSITGQLRLTMGLEELYEGFASPLVAVSLIVAADGLICLFSPSLWLATYAWINPAWRDATLPVAATIVTRIVAALSTIAACYFALIYSGRIWDIGVVLGLGLFGIACKLFGWNRLVLIMACVYSGVLEQTIRQSMLMSQGDLDIFFQRPISRALSIAAIGVVVLTIALTARRMRWRRQASP